jgi:hypothetical protein
VAVLGIVAGAMVGLASAGSGNSPALKPSASPSQSGPWGPWSGGPWGGPWAGDQSRPGPWGPAGLFDFRDALHGQVVVTKDGGGTQTLLIQKGDVTQVSATSVTLKSSDGYVKAYRITGDTLVDGDKGKAATLAAGSTVVLVAVQNGDDAVAQSVLTKVSTKASPSHS